MAPSYGHGDDPLGTMPRAATFWRAYWRVSHPIRPFAPLKPLRFVALAIVAVVVLSFFGSRRVAFHPNVVLVTIDTLRPDRLACYGHRRNRTPAIDRIANEGVLFANAYCDIPWTTGSMASVMTGTYGRTHGLQLPIHRLGPDAVTLAEILRDHGYQTGAIIASFPLDAIYGLDQGFDTYDDEFTRPMIAVPNQPIAHVGSRFIEDFKEQSDFNNKKFTNDAYRSDEEVTDAAIRWLEGRNKHRRFFLWVHYFGPHEKLVGDVGFHDQEPRIIAEYDHDVEATDRAVGRFLEALRATGEFERSILVIHADHGQSLGEHDYVGHGLDLHDVSVKIPLIMRFPRVFAAGSRTFNLAANVDILPTILDILEIDNPARVAGRSLVPGHSDKRKAAYFETYASTVVPVATLIPGLGYVLAPVAKRGVQTPEWKLITKRITGPCARGDEVKRDSMGAPYLVDPTELDVERCRQLEVVELYHGIDPELPETNVAADHPGMVTALAQQLASYGADTPLVRQEFALSAEQEQKLRSLGYLR